MTDPTDPQDPDSSDDWAFPQVPSPDAVDAISVELPSDGEQVFDTGSDAWWRQQAEAQRRAAQSEPAVPPTPPAAPEPEAPPELIEPTVLQPEPPAAAPEPPAAAPEPPAAGAEPVLHPTQPIRSPLDRDWLPPDLPELRPPAPPVHDPEPEPAVPVAEVSESVDVPVEDLPQDASSDQGTWAPIRAQDLEQTPSAPEQAAGEEPPAYEERPADEVPVAGEAPAEQRSVAPLPVEPERPAVSLPRRRVPVSELPADEFGTRAAADPQRVGPARAVAGAALAVAGVALAIGALLLAGKDEPKGSPTVASPPTATATASTQPTPTPTTTTTATPTTSAEPTSGPTSQASPTATTPVVEPTAAAPVLPVSVLNNSKIAKLADRAAARFKAAGWPIAVTGNYRGGTIPTTTVYFAPGQQASAERFAKEFGIPRVRPRFAGLPTKGMTVVLTRDYR